MAAGHVLTRKPYPEEYKSEFHEPSGRGFGLWMLFVAIFLIGIQFLP